VLALSLAGVLTLALAQAPLAAVSQGAVVDLAYDLSYLRGCIGAPEWAPLGGAPRLGWLNPGADLDASVSTDGEDLAAPVADVAEFRSKDAFLAVDALFGAATAAHVAAGAGSAVLATALAQDHL
jgi:hypothetical protein